MEDVLDPAKVYSLFTKMKGETTNLPDLKTAIEHLENLMDIKELYSLAAWDMKGMIYEV